MTNRFDDVNKHTGIFLKSSIHRESRQKQCLKSPHDIHDNEYTKVNSPFSRQ